AACWNRNPIFFRIWLSSSSRRPVISLSKISIEPSSGFCNPMISFSSTLLPVPLRPSTVSVSPRRTSRSMPSRTFCRPNDLRSALIPTAGLPLPFSIVLLLEDRDDQFHQHHIGQNHKERREYDGTGRRPPHALGAAARAHALETADQADQQAEDQRFESRREQIIKHQALKAVVDVKPERHRFGQPTGHPAHHDPAEIRHNRQQR